MLLCGCQNWQLHNRYESNHLLLCVNRNVLKYNWEHPISKKFNANRQSSFVYYRLLNLEKHSFCVSYSSEKRAFSHSLRTRAHTASVSCIIQWNAIHWHGMLASAQHNDTSQTKQWWINTVSRLQTEFQERTPKSIDKFDANTRYEMDAKGDCRHVELANRIHSTHAHTYWHTFRQTVER